MSFDYYRPNYDAHLIPWLKAKFGLTVQPNGPEFLAFKGDYDLDIPSVVDDSIWGAACEYGSCYDGEMCDRLAELELGRK